MSNALAIAATTAALQKLLTEQVPPLAGLGGLDVTTLPPDVAAKGEPKGRINLFLYQTVLNAAWRNLDTPMQVRPGENGRPPLALNLHYLVTAYDAEGADSLSHKILGGAMSVLHDHPVLGRSEIADALKQSELEAQFERLRITPLPMGLEEMSKLWMTFQTQYRISAAYEVTVVLIDSRRAAPSPLPVLRRGKEDRGPEAVAGGAPELREIRLPRSQAAARLGEEITIVGGQLTTDATKVRFTNLRGTDPISLDPVAGAKPDEITVAIPNAARDMSRWTPGFYTIALMQQRGDDGPPIVSNELAFALAPRITVTLDNTAVEDAKHFTVDLTVVCVPRVADEQRVLLLFGDRQAAATATITPGDLTQPTTFTFTVFGVEAGKYVVRLRVDGVDSIPVTYGGTPPVPEFHPAQTVTVT
jgi:hypothetical protein